MISLIILSHSKKIVEGIKELAYQMVKDTNIYAIGGSSDGTIGSDYNAMNDAVIDALSKGEVLVLFDLGSTVMTMQMVIDELEESEKEKIKIVDAALVEGSIQAAVDIEIGKDFSEIIKNLESLKLGKIQ